jgi:hypothetical protein
MTHAARQPPTASDPIPHALSMSKGRHDLGKLSRAGLIDFRA